MTLMELRENRKINLQNLSNEAISNLIDFIKRFQEDDHLSDGSFKVIITADLHMGNVHVKMHQDESENQEVLIKVNTNLTSEFVQQLMYDLISKGFKVYTLNHTLDIEIWEASIVL